MECIYHYIDFRKFLKDFYASQKKSKKYFSYRFFALRAGIRAPILLKMVIDGKRNLGPRMIEKFARGLGLKDKEAVFFRNLVLFNQAKTAVEKQEHYRVLREMTRQVPQKVIDEDHFEYYDTWYHSAIREGICHHDFRDRWDAVAACVQPAITPAQAREAVQWLLANGFLRRKREGGYEQVDKAITTRPEVASMAIRNFNRAMIRLAEQSLDRVPTDRRYAAGMTVGLSREAYQMLLAEIESFKDRIVNFVDTVDRPDRVYQVNIQAFPVMQTPESND
jgi:uncharacterized protein (TIGR02147 family)